MSSTSSKLINFIAWWLKGLSYLIPDSLRRIIQYAPDRITIEFKNQQVIFKYYSSEMSVPLDEQVFILDQEMQNASISQWLQKHGEKSVEVVLLIPEDVILHKLLVLPAAAGPNLRQVIGFEMDLRTPFSVDQVYFDYIIDKEDDEKHQLQLQLYVTPREQVDHLLEILGSLDIKPDALNIAGIKENLGLNLLPAEKRHSVASNQSNTMTLLLSIIAFSLFLAALYIPLKKQDDLLNQLEMEIANSRDVVTKLKDVKLQKDALVDKASFMVSKRNDYIPVIDVLNELTRIIPDDTWLIRFSMANGGIQLQGESVAASSMIQSIESSDFLTDVKFSSPVIYNEAIQKDRFNISAKLSGYKP